MKAASAIGIGLACALIMGAGIMEGVAPPALINIPAGLIVFGGTAGAILGGVGMQRFMLVPKLYIKAFTSAPPDLGARIPPGCSVTWLARLHGVQKVAGSNPVTPTETKAAGA